MISKHGFHISTGNMKLGNTPNLSTTPIRTCASGVPCAKSKACYALKAYRQYPNVRNAWDANTKLLEEGKYKELVEDVSEYIRKHKCKYFRFSVAGDIWNVTYWDSLRFIAEGCPGCRFWVYTKQYGVLDEWKKDLKAKGLSVPENLVILMSEWNDYKPCGESAEEHGHALYDDGSLETPENAFVCPSDCVKCKFHCAYMTKGDIVVFHAH